MNKELLTLRDYFSASTLSNAPSFERDADGKWVWTAEAIAERCGEIADAMLEERNKK